MVPAGRPAISVDPASRDVGSTATTRPARPSRAPSPSREPARPGARRAAPAVAARPVIATTARLLRGTHRGTGTAAETLSSTPSARGALELGLRPEAATRCRSVGPGQRLDVVRGDVVAAGQPGPRPAGGQQRGGAARGHAQRQRRRAAGWPGRGRRCSRCTSARPRPSRTAARPAARSAGPATGPIAGGGQVARVEAGGVPGAAPRAPRSRGGQRHRQLEQEPVELRLRQRVGALVLDRVLGGGDR